MKLLTLLLLSLGTAHAIDLRDPCTVYGWAAFYIQDERMAQRGKVYLDSVIQDLRNQRVEVGPKGPQYDLLSPLAMNRLTAYTYSFKSDVYPDEVRRRLMVDCTKDMRR